MSAPTYQPQPGDHCRIIGNFQVKHFEPCCDGHKDGTVTDVRTGKVVSDEA